ncbi:unnamed protein product [Mesocestoides corti]|uniref:Uncharacterized protein n=1 Tax=Mesocestoides corti TaxID=53468 RepID=A0A0R3UQ81_MESCO|nr:unnamed protein product [Mesocestoides corti]
MPCVKAPRAQHYEIVGVGLCEPAGEAAESTEMIVASFDPYCGYQNSLGRMKSQEHCTALLMRGKFNPGESNLRSGRAGAAAVHTEESLVVLGGFELERGWFGKRGANILKTIEILIPKNRKDFPPMLQPRAFHSASCVSQTIIVAGGGEGGHFDVEAYAFTSGRLLDGQWTNVRIASTVDKLRYDSFLFGTYTHQLIM